MRYLSQKTTQDVEGLSPHVRQLPHGFPVHRVGIAVLLFHLPEERIIFFFCHLQSISDLILVFNRKTDNSTTGQLEQRVYSQCFFGNKIPCRVVQSKVQAVV